jgi:hypothetical protein
MVRLTKKKDISASSAPIATNVSRLYPCKTTATLALYDTSCRMREFCHLVSSALVLFRDKIEFHFNGYMDCQSDRRYSAEKVPLYDVKVGVWCAMSGTI